MDVKRVFWFEFGVIHFFFFLLKIIRPIKIAITKKILSEINEYFSVHKPIHYFLTLHTTPWFAGETGDKQN